VCDALGRPVSDGALQFIAAVCMMIAIWTGAAASGDVLKVAQRAVAGTRVAAGFALVTALASIVALGLYVDDSYITRTRSQSSNAAFYLWGSGLASLACAFVGALIVFILSIVSSLYWGSVEDNLSKPPPPSAKRGRTIDWDAFAVELSKVQEARSGSTPSSAAAGATAASVLVAEAASTSAVDMAQKAASAARAKAVAALGGDDKEAASTACMEEVAAAEAFLAAVEAESSVGEASSRLSRARVFAESQLKAAKKRLASTEA
jgi:hypothetical protein